MPRPTILKKISSLPKYTSFQASNDNDEIKPIIVLSHEEFETIRLIDYNNLSQFDCAELMQVSRPTVGLLYNNARQKISNYLINGGNLIIAGGNYEIYNPDELNNHCSRRRNRNRHCNN